MESCSLGRIGPWHVRNEVAKPQHRAALTKCDQDDVLEVASLANSVRLLRLVTCAEVAFAFVGHSIVYIDIHRCVGI